jgi:hypothetical protein
LLSGVVLGLGLSKDSIGNLELTMRWTMEAGSIANAWNLLCCGFADWACESHETPFGQLHNSLNGSSVGHGGMELRLAPPPDADTLVPDATGVSKSRPQAAFRVPRTGKRLNEKRG